MGARSLYDTAALHITEEPLEPIEILMKPGGGSITGRVRGAENFPEVRVVLVPAERLRKNALLYKTATLTPERRSFNFANVAPGEYKMFAFSSLPPGAAEQDPQFIAEQEQEGTPITVADGSTLEVSPKLISLK
jgi:hypothetical protein